MLKFFKLKTLDTASGIVSSATFGQRIAWLVAGCPLRDPKVVARFVEKKNKDKEKTYRNERTYATSNTFSLPSS